MYLDQINITNLRTLVEAQLDLVHPEDASETSISNVNLLLGGNGAGKTTVLRGIALSLLSPLIESSGYVPQSMVRRIGGEYADRASIRSQVLLHAQDIEGKASSTLNQKHSLGVDIIRKRSTEIVEAVSLSEELYQLWEAIYDDESPAFLLVGYGATRRIESSENFDLSVRRKSRHLRYQRVASLFEDHVSLTPLAAWLPQMKSGNPGRYKQVVQLVDRLLPDPFKFEGDFEDGDYHFLQAGNPVRFGALSDGYRAYLGWITDLLYHVCMGCPSGKKLVDNYGVVLVDEIDLHLHPSWQRMIVPMISEILPNLQFVLTTHSPLVAGTLERENIHVFESSSNGSSRVRQLEESVHGLTSDQVLLSSYFNLDSTRAPVILEEISRLAGKSSAANSESALEAMRMLASGKPSSDAEVSRRARPRIPSKTR